MPILVVAEHDNQSLKNGTYHAVSAAALCGQDIHVLVAGSACQGVAEKAAKMAGVTRVLMADAPHLQHGLPEDVAAQVLSIAGKYSHILAGATSFGKAMMPRVAAKLDVNQISEMTKVISADTFERPVYSSNAIATVQSSDPVKVITVRTTAFAPAVEDGSAAPVEPVAAVAGNGKSSYLSHQVDKSHRPELSSAKIVVAGGQGVGSAENFRLIEQLADKLGAAVGASRSAVDAGFISNDLQVGQTGKIVAPDLYIAVGISGAVQHVAGIKDARTIVVINQDPDAPIFLTADYGIVGDLNKLVPELIAALD